MRGRFPISSASRLSRCLTGNLYSTLCYWYFVKYNLYQIRCDYPASGRFPQNSKYSNYINSQLLGCFTSGQIVQNNQICLQLLR